MPCLIDHPGETGADQVWGGVETAESGHDVGLEPAPPVFKTRDPWPCTGTHGVGQATGEGVQVERGEVPNLLSHTTDFKCRRRSHRDQPDERGREAIEVWLHNGSLLVVKEGDVPLPHLVLPRWRSDGPVVASATSARPRSIASNAVSTDA